MPPNDPPEQDENIRDIARSLRISPEAARSMMERQTAQPLDFETFGYLGDYPTRPENVDVAPWARTDERLIDFFSAKRQQQAPADPLSDFFKTKAAASLQTQAVSRNAAMMSAIATNPDQEAAIRKMASRMEMPVSLVRGMGMAEAQNKVARDNVNPANTPSLAKAYSQPDWAQLAIDDWEKLSDVERIIRQAGGWQNEIGNARRQINEFEHKLFLGQPLRPSEQLKYQDLENRIRVLSQQQKAGETGPSYVLNVISGTATDVASSLPEMAIYGTVGLIGGPQGARYGAQVGSAFYNYRQIVGTTFKEYRNIRDQTTGEFIDQDVARGGAFINAIFSVGLETFADKVLLGLVVPGAEKFLSTPGKDVVSQLLQSEGGRNVMMRVGKKVATGAIVEAVTEAIQEGSAILGGETVKAVAPGDFAPISEEETRKRIQTAAIEGGIGGGGLAGIAAGPQIIIENRAIARAERELATSKGSVDAVERAVQAASESKLIARDRGELEKFIDDAAADGPVSTVYFSADDLANVAREAGLEPQQLAQQLGVTDQIQPASVTNSLLEMPVGKFIATVSDTDLAKPLIQVIKTNPFLLNRAEQEAYSSGGRQDIIAEADRLVQQALTDETFAAEAQSIQDEVLQQFRAFEGGEVFTPEVNRAYATITTQGYVSLARRMGISPREAYQKYQTGPLQIQRQAATEEGMGQPVLAQAKQVGYEGQNIGEAQEWVRAREKGLDMSQEGRLQRAREMGFDTRRVLYHGTTADVKEFRPSKDGTQGEGIYLTEDADFASRYAYEFTGNGGNVIPVYVRGPLASKQEWSDLFDEMSGQLPEGATTADIDAAVFDILKSRGFTGIKSDTADGSKSVISIFDPSNIRSVNAAFDPEFAESANILAQEQTLGQERELDAMGFYSAVQEAAVRVPDNIWNMGWQAARNALAKGRDGITPKKTEIEYLGLDAVFGDTKLKGAELKTLVLEHIAAKRLALVENFVRFDPNEKKMPSKRAMLEAMSPQALSSLINVEFQNQGDGRGKIVSDLGNPLYLYIQRKGEALASPTYYDLMQPQPGGEAKVIATGTIGDLDPIVGKMIFDANPERAVRRIDKDALAEAYQEGYASNLVRGPGDIRLPGEDVPMFEAVIGIPKGVPGAEYQAPVSHVGGKAKGTLVTAHGEERIDDKGQRTIFVGQVQSDMAQGAREAKEAAKEANAENPYAGVPLITTSEWTNVAVRAMIYRAARQGFQSISFPTGETSAIIQGNEEAVMHYETNVKGALEKIARQLGGEVRRGGVVTPPDGRYRVTTTTGPFAGQYSITDARGADQARLGDPTARIEPEPETASAYILDLTPEMRSKIVTEGVPLFAPGRRAQYQPDLNRIMLLPKADWSSYLHEMGHHFLEVYNNAALQISQIPEADRTPDEQKLVDDMSLLLTDMARQAGTPITGDVLQWWANTPLAARTPVHEKYAQATEKYFMEGKAPVPELQSLFDKFRDWLIETYKRLATALNVELSDEVRGVMDRMYAAHETVRTAEYNRKLVALFREKPEDMTEQEWTAYQQLAAQATDDAQSDLTARSLRDMQWLSGARARVMRELQRENADKRKVVAAEVTAEVMAQPVNVARSFLRRGIAPNGEPVVGPHKLSIDLLKARYPDVANVEWKRLGYGQYGMLAKDGMDPDMAAELLGYPSGDAMINDLLSAPPSDDVIKTETDRRMLERFGDLNDETKLSRAADEVIHSAMRAKVLQAEYAALSKAAKQTRPVALAAKEIAKEIVGRQVASKLNLNRYLAAERAAGRKAEAAMRSGDFRAAASAKRDQLLNFEVVREVQRVLKERNRALDLFSRINKAKRDTVAKTRNYDLVQAARAILAAYGFGSVKNKPMDYIAAVRAYDPALYAALEPTIIDAIATKQTIDQMTVSEFLGMRDVVRKFWDLSREEMKVDIEGRQLELEEITNELNQQLEAQGATPKGFSTEAPTEWQKNLREFGGLKGATRRVESWARLFDRGKVAAFTKYIWRPISEAADRYRADRNKYIMQFRELFRGIENNMGGGKINAPEINYTFVNKAELLHAIMHTGNGSNKRKLLLGRGWGTEDQDGNLIDNAWQNLISRLANQGILTKADFDFAQSVWDLLEEIKPLAQKAHRKVFGSYFAEITAEEVQTPFGTYRGGYAPAIYDTYNVQDAALRAQQDAVEANDSTMFPSPASNFTKGRVEYNRELALDLRLFPQHIDKVLKFAHLAAPVRDVLKILRNKGFSAMLESVDPVAQSDVLLPWLTRAARQIIEEPSKGQGGPMIDRIFRVIRQRSGMGLMFANLVNTAQQVTGFSLAALTVKPKYLASGLVRYTRNPMAITKAIRQASPMMADRGDNQLAAMYGTIDKIIDKNNKYGQVKDWFGRHTYFMQQAVQNVMDVIVWLGAYDQALAQGATEQEAAKQGDAAVRQTQGSLLPEDVSRVETGTPMLRTFVQMYGYFNMWGNLLSTEVRTTMSDMGLKKGAGRLMFVYLAGAAVPILFAKAIADGMRGQLPEDEDDDGWLEEWLAWFFVAQTETATAFIPVVGQAINTIPRAFINFVTDTGEDVPYDERVAGSPAISAVEGALRTISGKTVYDAIAEDGDKSKAIKDVLSLITLVTGVPVQALSRPIGYAVDVAEGDIEPTSELDYIRGLVTGTASEASRQ